MLIVFFLNLPSFRFSFPVSLFCLLLPNVLLLFNLFSFYYYSSFYTRAHCLICLCYLFCPFFCFPYNLSFLIKVQYYFLFSPLLFFSIYSLLFYSLSILFYASFLLLLLLFLFSCSLLSHGLQRVQSPTWRNTFPPKEPIHSQNDTAKVPGKTVTKGSYEQS